MTTKLTKWEVGQELIAASDRLFDAETELRKGGFKKLATVLKECRLTIGDHFNALESHSFGLTSHTGEGRKRK